MMMIELLFDEGGLVNDTHELTCHVNRVAARLRMHRNMQSKDDLFLSSDEEAFAKKQTTGKSSSRAAVAVVDGSDNDSVIDCVNEGY